MLARLEDIDDNAAGAIVVAMAGADDVVVGIVGGRLGDSLLFNRLSIEPVSFALQLHLTTGSPLSNSVQLVDSTDVPKLPFSKHAHCRESVSFAVPSSAGSTLPSFSPATVRVALPVGVISSVSVPAAFGSIFSMQIVMVTELFALSSSSVLHSARPTRSMSRSVTFSADSNATSTTPPCPGTLGLEKVSLLLSRTVTTFLATDSTCTRCSAVTTSCELSLNLPSPPVILLLLLLLPAASRCSTRFVPFFSFVCFRC